MRISTISSRTFNQDTGGAKRAAKNGPVVITDRGQPAYVLLSQKDYEALQTHQPDIVQLLAMPQGDQVEFEPPRAGKLFKPARF